MSRKTIILWVAFGLLLWAGRSTAIASDTPPPIPASQGIRDSLLKSYLTELEEDHSIQLNSGQDFFTPYFDEVFISGDGNSAMIWIALRDSNGIVLATEPGLILARLEKSGWKIVFPGDAQWGATLAAFPSRNIPAEHSPSPQSSSAADLQINALTGYYLPYVAGTARWLEGSILHFHNFPVRGYPSCSKEACQFAYDFTDHGHFPLIASKEGTVVVSRDSCADGNSNCTNYIVLRNSADAYYQIYLHLAHGTIPDSLTPGVLVKRGQFIGDTDDTGYSTSEHVHFMVTGSYWWAGDHYPWGNSLDIRFEDVSINDGVPRTCYEVTQIPISGGATECLGNKSDPLNPSNDWFVSGNVGAFPPTGNLTRPTEGRVVANGVNPLMDVTAVTSDDVRVNQAVLLAFLDGTWKELSPRVNNPTAAGVFDWDVNLCEQGVTNGALQLRLKIWDHEGNVVEMPDIRTVNVDHACPPPISEMTASTVYDGNVAELHWVVTPSASGISKFELQWREAGTPWSDSQLIELPSSSRSTRFVGSLGTTYEFRLRALDVNHQTESWPVGDVAEQTVTFPVSCIPDDGEEDDNYLSSELIPLGHLIIRNVCPRGDVDWFRLDTTAGQHYAVSTFPLGGAGASMNLSVFAADGITLVGESLINGWGTSNQLLFYAGEQPFVFLRAESAMSDIEGNAMQYSIQTSHRQVVFLPLVHR